ncbi:MAG TPA: VOC family protein [Sphingomicrobium sp.]|nr:VOC family protein [Sphingomicrobium sp.]
MKLDHILIMVRSLDASLNWYTTLLESLSFTKTRDHVWYDGELAIDLQQAEPDTPDYARRGPGLNHLGFTAPSESELDRVRSEMAAAGFDVPEKQRFGNDIATFFKDPEGMRIEVAVYA